MIVTTKTTIGFTMPDEYKKMVEFEEEHQGWIKHESTMMVSFSQERRYSVDLEGGDTE